MKLKLNPQLTLILTMCTASSIALGMNETTKNRLDVLQKQICPTKQTQIEKNITTEEAFSKELQEKLQVLKDKLNNQQSVQPELLVSILNLCKTQELFEKILKSIMTADHLDSFSAFISDFQALQREMVLDDKLLSSLMPVFKSLINKDTIVKMKTGDLLVLLLQNCAPSQHRKIFDEFVSLINKDNFKDVHPDIIRYFIKLDNLLYNGKFRVTETFCTFITAETLATISPKILKAIVVDNHEMHATILNHISESIRHLDYFDSTEEILESLKSAKKSTFEKLITSLLNEIMFDKENYYYDLLQSLVKNDPYAISKLILRTAINIPSQDNLVAINPHYVLDLFDIGKQWLMDQRIGSCINQTNFQDVDPLILEKIIKTEYRNKFTDTFFKTFLGYVTCDNFLSIKPETILSLFDNDASAGKQTAQKISPYITKNNFLHIDVRIIERFVSHNSIQDFLDNKPSKEAGIEQKFFSYLTKSDSPTLISIVEKNLQHAAPTYVYLIFKLCDSLEDFENLIKNILKDVPITDVAPATLQAMLVYSKTLAEFIAKKINIQDVTSFDMETMSKQATFSHRMFPVLVETNSACCSILAKLIDKNSITHTNIAMSLIPSILKIDTSYAQDIGALLDTTHIDYSYICEYVIPALLNADSSLVKAIIPLINEGNITHENNIKWVIPHLLKTNTSSATDIGMLITTKNIQNIPLSLLQVLICHDKKDLIINTIKKVSSNRILLNNDLVEIYLIDNKKGADYVNNNQLQELLKIKNNTITKKPSYQHFKNTYNQIIHRFDNYFIDAKDKRISLLKMLKQEKVEHDEHNRLYQMYHGRAGTQFVTDHTFQYLQEIFFNKSIDKKSHYAQHYAFPGEVWATTITSKGKVYDFRGSPINLCESNIEYILKQGITTDEEYSYERSCLQFASDLFGIKGGSSALSYTLGNHNVDKSRGASSIEKLFNQLGKAMGKDLSSYYKKYEKHFEHLVELGKKFEHGTMLMYSFSKDMFQKYVYATHDSGGHKTNAININGKETFDPVLVQDTLRNNPEQFDDQNKAWEYCIILTDEGVANPFHDDIRTYHFNIGKHDEQLAQEIKHKLAYLFERIKIDMIQDGIIEYCVKSKL